MRYTKKAILDWVEDCFMTYDILSIIEELLGEGYREWLIKEVTKVLRGQDSRDIEDHFDEDLIDPAMATIRRAKRGDIVKAIIDGMGYDDEEDIFESMSRDLGEETNHD